MRRDKGFTLIEIIIVLIITGILVALATPSYLTSMRQGATTSTEHNLIAIYNAQKSNYFNTGSYCIANCTSLANIDSTTGLSLGLTDTTFNSYICSSYSSGVSCQATSSSIPGVTLTVYSTMPIVLSGGGSCATPSGANCNPSCTGSSTNLCPSS